jgi:phosphoribosylanthranilate isomerase
LTCVDQARACAELGADWIGINFHPASSRYIPTEKAAEIVAALPSSVSAVGIFVNQPAAAVAEVAGRVGLRIVQLHGDESPEELAALSHLRVVKAFRLEGPFAWDRVQYYVARVRATGFEPEAVLVDSYVAGFPGGTGATIAEHLLQQVPPLPRLILAGGLTPENVTERVALVRPWMVDVASGVESAPGQKDLAKVAAFIAAVRATGSDRPRGFGPDSATRRVPAGVDPPAGDEVVDNPSSDL